MKKQVQVVPVVSVVNNQTTVTSQNIAKVFGKRHDHVIRDINDIINKVPESFSAPNFGVNKISVLRGSGEEISHYNITRDGFTILVMGFTGAKAMMFKLAYIEAFNKMEAALHTKALPPPSTLSPAQQRRIQQLVGEKVYATNNKAMYPTYFKHIYRSIKDRFQVGKYDQVPESKFNELEEYILKIDMGEQNGKMEAIGLIIEIARQTVDVSDKISEIYQRSLRTSDAMSVIERNREAYKGTLNLKANLFDLMQMLVGKKEITDLREIAEVSR